MIAALFAALDLLNFSYPGTPCNFAPPVQMYSGATDDASQNLSIDSIKYGSLRAGTRQAVVVMSCAVWGGTSRAAAYVYDLRGDTATLLRRVAGTIWGVGSDTIRAGFSNDRLYVDVCRDPTCTWRRFSTYAMRGTALVRVAARTHLASETAPIPTNVDFLNFVYHDMSCTNIVKESVGPPISIAQRVGSKLLPLRVLVSSIKEGSMRAGTHQALVELDCRFWDHGGGQSSAYVFDVTEDSAIPLGLVGGSEWGGDGGCDGLRSRFENRFLFLNECQGMNPNVGTARTFALRGGKLVKTDERTVARIGRLTNALGQWQEALASYSFEQHETVSIGGSVAREASFQVSGEPYGQRKRTPSAAPLIRRSMTSDNWNYATELAALAQRYSQPDPSRLQQLYENMQIGLDPPTTAIVTTFIVHSYAKPDDTVRIAFDGLRGQVLRLDISTYLTGRSDMVTIAANVASSNCGYDHVVMLTAKSLSRNLTVSLENSDFTHCA